MSESSHSGKTNTHLVSDDIKDTKERFLGPYSPKSLVKLEFEKVAARVIAHGLLGNAKIGSVDRKIRHVTDIYGIFSEKTKYVKGDIFLLDIYKIKMSIIESQ
jgi:hypothetical protein